ncbi:MAG: GNAT family N-acetyltransferase, partial [Solirubrobacterales bacterium]
RYDLMEIRRLPEGDESIGALAAAARAAGRWSIVEPDITSPIVDTTGTLDQYRAATRSKWHKNLRRLYRKLERDHGARLRLVEPPAELESELAEGFEVESSGWKRAAGSAILSRPENEAYYRSLARRFHDRGELRLSSISVAGRMIAWDFGILRANRLYSPKSGYLEEFRQLAPGLVLELATIERCFELDIEAHELLGADEAYKLRFSTSARRHRYFRAYRRRPAQALRYAWRRYVPAGARARLRRRG